MEKLGAILNRNKRLVHEYKNIAGDNSLQLEVSLTEDDNLESWDLKLRSHNFPTSSGLYEDLKKCQQLGMQDFILLRVTFPTQYPIHPPFFRVVSPRFRWHTGIDLISHVGYLPSGFRACDVGWINLS